MAHPKRYSSKSNCIRAAKAALGPEAIEGTDFTVDQNKNGYAFTEKAPAAPKAAKPAAPKATAKAVGQAMHSAMLEGASPQEAVAAAAKPPVDKKAAKEAKRAARADEKAALKAAKGPTKAKIAEDLMRRPQGATSQELMDATGWQAHSVRGFIAGALKKQEGVAVRSERKDGVTTYFCTDATPATEEPKAEGDDAPELA